MSQAEKNGFSSVTFFVMISSDRSNNEKDAALRDLSNDMRIIKRPYPNGYSQTAIPKRALPEWGRVDTVLNF